jgi:hypothetical protein
LRPNPRRAPETGRQRWQVKLQALVNDPSRTRDLEDIRALLRANRGTLDTAELRGYFALLDREALLDELLRETG